MQVNDQVLWHEILAAVLRQYAGQQLPYELVVRKPAELGSDRDTIFVNDRPDGLHMLISHLRPTADQAGASLRPTGS